MVGKNFVDIATESAFATAPATGWKGLRVADDGHKARVATYQPGGIVRGQQGPQFTGAHTVTRGGTGTLKPYLQSNGLGQLLRATFGSAALTTPVGATLARQMAFTTTDAVSAYSLATQIGREMLGGTIDPDTYVGGQVTEMRLSQAIGQASGSGDEALAKLEFDLDYADLSRATAAHGSSTYDTVDLFFGSAECTLSIGPAGGSLDDKCLNKFELKLPTGVDVDPACIGPTFREEGPRGSLPQPMLSLGWDYAARTYYDAFLDGTEMAFQAVWEPAGTAYEIESGFNPKVTLDIPLIRFVGDTPEMSSDKKTSQGLEAEIGHNGTDPMVSLTIITSDTAF